MQFQQEKGIGPCGLACVLCREEKCPGCHAKGCTDQDTCAVHRCCGEKNLNGCWECSAFPCDQPIFQNTRTRAFVRCAKEDGLELFMKNLARNFTQGVVYHTPNDLPGDYDLPASEPEVIHLLRTGRRPDPFETFPVYRTEQLTFRNVEEDDAADLFRCYSDPISLRHLNHDNCTTDFAFQTVDAMKDYIRVWQDEYRERRYLRWSVVEQHTETAIGTIELVPISEPMEGIGKVGILRIDLLSSYETEAIYRAILEMAIANYYRDFQIDWLITKAFPADRQRVRSLLKHHFAAIDGILPYPHYFARQQSIPR